MEKIVELAQVWAATIKDQQGGLASVLSGLQDAGADLNFILARRSSDKPGEGAVFVTPLRSDEEIAAAANLGFNVTSSVHSISVQGDNKPGAAAEVANKLAGAGLNLRGFSAATSGSRYVIYIGFDSENDAATAIQVLNEG